MRTFNLVACVLCSCVVSAGVVPGVATAASVERRVHVGQAEASSYDKNGWNRFEENYLPLYVADDDPKTAWTEGAQGAGAGEWIRLHHSTMAGATKLRLKIRNGYQKSGKLFAANARAQKVSVKLLPGGKTIEIELKDAEGWQEIVVEQPKGDLSGVELKAVSVYPGKKYDDLCISDVQLFVTAETPDNPGYEKSVFERVLKWKSDRIAAAEVFKKARAEKPLPVASQYQSTREKDAPNDNCVDSACYAKARLIAADADTATKPERAAIAFLKTAIDNKLSGWKAVTLVPRAAKLPTIDGTCAPGMASCEFDMCQDPMLPIQGMPLTTTDSFDILEVRSDVPADAALSDTLTKNKACHSKTPKTFTWAQRTVSDGKVHAVLVAVCGMVEGREGSYASATTQLLAYDDEGRLRATANRTAAATYRWDDAKTHISGGRFASWGEAGSFSEVTEVAKAK